MHSKFDGKRQSEPYFAEKHNGTMPNAVRPKTNASEKWTLTLVEQNLFKRSV